MDLYVLDSDRPFFEEAMGLWHGSKRCVPHSQVVPAQPEASGNPEEVLPTGTFLTMRSPCIFGLCGHNNHADYSVHSVWNTEQMTRQNLVEAFVDSCKAHNVQRVIDYSEGNKRILQDRGLRVEVWPSTTFADVGNLRFLMQRGRHAKFTVGFVGTLNERRYRILSALTNQGIQVSVIQQFGRDRDEQLAKCWALLNIHFAEDYQVFEAFRCHRWALAKMPIISETCMDQLAVDPRLGSVVRFVPYDKLVGCVVDLHNSHSAADDCISLSTF